MRFTISFINPVPFSEKVFFVKNLALMIKAGLSLREGVATIREQTHSKKFEKVLDNIIKRLDNGEPLGDSLAKHPEIFSGFFINMIRIGEASGTLEENLRHLTLQLEKSYDLKRKVTGAMIYPAIILVSTFGLGGALSVFILPKLIPLFRSLDIELPLSTKILLWIVELIQKYGLFALIGFIGFIVFIILISRLRPVKTVNHKILLKLPVAGTISRNVNLAFFSRTLGTLIKSGVSIVEALDITAGTLANVIYQSQSKEISLRVQRGEQISTYLKTQPNLFSTTFSRMIEVGEKTGNLEESLFYLAEFYEKEIDNITKKLSTILEPILLIIIGFIVGFIAISIITPIYQLTRGLS